MKTTTKPATTKPARRGYETKVFSAALNADGKWEVRKMGKAEAETTLKKLS